MKIIYQLPSAAFVRSFYIWFNVGTPIFSGTFGALQRKCMYLGHWSFQSIWREWPEEIIGYYSAIIWLVERYGIQNDNCVTEWSQCKSKSWTYLFGHFWFKYRPPPQGGGVSPLFFIVYLGACLRQVRERFPPRPGEGTVPVSESQCVDGCDWCRLSILWLGKSCGAILSAIEDFGFKVKRNKTEWTTLHHVGQWENCKQLSSLLDGVKDWSGRIVLANLAFNSFQHLCKRKSGILLSRKMKVCNAFVAPVLTYNFGTWGHSDVYMRKLNAVRRRHLRGTSGVKWPEGISNTELPKRSNAFNLEDFVRKSPLTIVWSCFTFAAGFASSVGHVLLFSLR